MDDLMRQLGELRRHADRLRDLLSDPRDAVPAHAEGTDRTGSVHVEIGPDALPTRFRVAPDWQRRITPDTFGQAVIEACQVAAGARLAAWTARLKDPRSGHQSASDRSTPYVSPRPLEDITEDLLRAFDDLGQTERYPSQPAPGVRGVAGNGRLTLTLSRAGLTSCGSEPRWTADQTGARLTMALAEALDGARAQLAVSPATSRLADRSGGLDALFAVAMALLNDSRRLAG